MRQYRWWDAKRAYKKYEGDKVADTVWPGNDMVREVDVERKHFIETGERHLILEDVVMKENE